MIINNGIDNFLPSDVSINLANLEMMDMTSNLLGNDDWAGICNVPRLYTIAVAYNSFSLIFPSCLATTPTLNYLDVSNNNVFGPVTDPLGTYTNLTTLKAAHCSLNGTVPMSIGGLKKLQLLDMSNNRLSGEIGRASCRERV